MPCLRYISALRRVAEPGSAPALGAGCREFESLHADQFFGLFLVIVLVTHLPVAQPDRAPTF